MKQFIKLVLLYLAPICLGVLLMFLDKPEPAGNYFTYMFTGNPGTLGIIGGVLFYGGILLNLYRIGRAWYNMITA